MVMMHSKTIFMHPIVAHIHSKHAQIYPPLFLPEKWNHFPNSILVFLISIFLTSCAPPSSIRERYLIYQCWNEPINYL